MATVAPAPTSAQQTAPRLPRRLRRAFLLGIRAQRTRRYVYPDGIYTARNQEWAPVVAFGTVEVERAADRLSETEREYFLAGLRASFGGHPNSPRMQLVLRYSKLLRELIAAGDEGMASRLRRWLRNNLLRKPAQAEQAAVRA
jgi:hypothetical protein